MADTNDMVIVTIISGVVEGIKPTINKTNISSANISVIQSSINICKEWLLMISVRITPHIKAIIGGRYPKDFDHSPWAAHIPSKTILPVWALAKTPSLLIKV